MGHVAGTRSARKVNRIRPALTGVVVTNAVGGAIGEAHASVLTAAVVVATSGEPSAGHERHGCARGS